MRGSLVVCQDAEALAVQAAELIDEAMHSAVSDRGWASIMLSGGSTPRRLYLLLAEAEYKKRLPWAKIHVFWSDERWVTARDPENNARMAYETLLSKVPIQSGNIHRIETDRGTPAESAETYAKHLREIFGLKPAEVPVFDLVLLGLGQDGHTASLFPGTPAVVETVRLVVANRVEQLQTDRITATARLLNAARRVVFLVSGREKATVLREVLTGRYEPERLPAQLVQPVTGRALFLADRTAGGGR